MGSDDVLEKLRRAEVELVRPWIEPGMRVLEIGGGSGFQASIMASWGAQVVSVDVPRQTPGNASYYPVQSYDGRVLPFADGGFDRVYSSNVLEHVGPLVALLREARRVMRPDGLAVHLLPTPAWRFWTSATHYPFLLKRGIAAMRPPAGGRGGVAPELCERVRRRGVAHVLRRTIFPGPHGEYPNAVAELYYFSRAR